MMIVLRLAPKQCHEVVAGYSAYPLSAEIPGEAAHHRVEVDDRRVGIRREVVLRDRMNGAGDAVYHVRIRRAEFGFVDEPERQATVPVAGNARSHVRGRVER